MNCVDPLIIADDHFTLPAHIHAMLPQEIIGKGKSHILLITVIIGAIKE